MPGRLQPGSGGGGSNDPADDPSTNEGTDDWGLTPGSNNWVDGTREFLADPGQAVRDPYDFAAGVGDAAALNFDEGIGGLTSLVDGYAGNTAGPGESPFLERPREGQPQNPGLPNSEPDYTGDPDPSAPDPIPTKLKLAVAFVATLVTLYLARPLLEIGAGVVGE